MWRRGDGGGHKYVFLIVTLKSYARLKKVPLKTCFIAWRLIEFSITVLYSRDKFVKYCIRPCHFGSILNTFFFSFHNFQVLFFPWWTPWLMPQTTSTTTTTITTTMITTTTITTTTWIFKTATTIRTTTTCWWWEGDWM